MIWLLRIFFSLVILVMLAVTIWASRHESILEISGAVSADPWFRATLGDAYFGFLTFFVWVAYKERSLFSKIAWLIAILVLGNMAMASYALLELCRVPATSGLREVLLRRETA